MSKRVITGEAIACLSPYSGITLDDIREGNAKSVTDLCYWKHKPAESAAHEYVPIGKATITVEIVDAKEATQAAVEMLRRKQQSVLAEAQKKANEIDERIQSLLAISYEPAEII